MKRFLIFIGLVTAIAISLNAQEYSFKVEVFGKGKPILLIPGLSSSGDIWDETVDHLNANYECHVVTLPGFAGQPAIETDQFLVDMGNELIDYLKSNKLKKPAIIGHSLGGFLTLYIGSNEPALPSKLIVVDGLPFLGSLQNPAATPKDSKPMANMMRNNILNQTAEQYDAMQPMMLKSMINADEDIETSMKWGRASDKATVAQAMYELYQIDLRDDLANIKAPTLVLGAWVGYKPYGATRASTEFLYKGQFEKLEGVRIEFTDIGKHFIMWDDPEFFNAQVTNFLK